MKTFALLPHEIPPGCNAPLEAPAQCVFMWEGQTILVRELRIAPARFAVFVRRREQNFVVCHPLNFLPLLSSQPRLHSKLARTAQLAVKREQLHLTRLTHLRGYTVFQAFQGHSIWLDDFWNESALFQFDWVQNGFRALKRELEKPYSDASFALSWLGLSPRLRHKKMLADREEIEHLWRWILVVTPALWTKPSRWILGFNEELILECHANLWERFTEGISGKSVQNTEFGVHLVRWRHFIRTQFLPTPGYALWKKHICTRAAFPKRASFQIEVTNPTFHEQIEARLNLENWLDQNVSPGLKTRLLP